MKGIVSNIQRFSIHDGPGIRTTVFLKGCNLRCFWCHNPESLNMHPELQVFPDKCIGCGKCFQICPVNAHQVIEGQKIFKREICKQCGKCAQNCYAEALLMVGQEMTVDEVMKEVAKDRLFYENSRGGVTFSGGEALLQKDFVKALLIDSKNHGFHTAIDTAGHVSWQTFEEILPYVDLVLYDLKRMDSRKHQDSTGAENTRISNNLKKLATKGMELWIRIPIIPGLNDNLNEVEKMADSIQALERVDLVELLPFHGLGQNKYESLGMEYKAKDYKTPSKETMDKLAKVFEDRGLLTKKGD